ncbi:MAG TPA: hypothetical protein VMV92_07055 [Streptosporangiaceae bacterium]|nr:hypothetical protein [Streptosporangiaceae bacterium]
MQRVTCDYLRRAGGGQGAFGPGGEERDYATREDARLRGPLTPLLDGRMEIVDNGLIDQMMQFVNRNIGHQAGLAGARREEHPDYPLEAVREAVVNAVAHRDHTIAVADIEVAIFSNRIEVISPGRGWRRMVGPGRGGRLRWGRRPL